MHRGAGAFLFFGLLSRGCCCCCSCCGRMHWGPLCGWEGLGAVGWGCYLYEWHLRPLRLHTTAGLCDMHRWATRTRASLPQAHQTQCLCASFAGHRRHARHPRHAVGDLAAGPRGGHPLPRPHHPRAGGGCCLWVEFVRVRGRAAEESGRGAPSQELEAAASPSSCLHIANLAAARLAMCRRSCPAPRRAASPSLRACSGCS